jgi:hypothetical protein
MEAKVRVPVQGKIHDIYEVPKQRAITILLTTGPALSTTEGHSSGRLPSSSQPTLLLRPERCNSQVGIVFLQSGLCGTPSPATLVC